jgi:hypothetical protein
MASKRIKIRMNSTGETEKGKPTGYFKTTTRTTASAQSAADSSKTSKTKNKSGKLEKRMFDPRAWNPETGRRGKHVIFKEGKIK